MGTHKGRGIWVLLLEKVVFSFGSVILLVGLLFFLLGLSSRDPSLTLLGKSARLETVAQIRLRLGLEASVWVQLGRALKSGLTLDFGCSLVSHEPVLKMIGRSVGPTVCLMIPGYFLSLGLGIGLAGVSAFVESSRTRWIGRAAAALGACAASLSLLVYTVLGQYCFGYLLEWFPISGWDRGPLERFRYTALPSLIFSVACVGTHFIFFRQAFLNQAGKGYVLMARAKGLSEMQIFRGHVLRNGMLLLGTLVGIEIPFLFLGSFLIESYFGIPGMGNLVVDAVRDSDLPVIYGVTVIAGLLGLMSSLIADFFSFWVDPRVQS